MIGVDLSPGTELICIDARPYHVPVPLVQGGLYTLTWIYEVGATGYAPHFWWKCKHHKYIEPY